MVLHNLHWLCRLLSVLCTYIPTRCALDRWWCTQIKKLSCIFPPQVPICGWAGHYICALIGVLSQSSSVHVTHMYYYNNHRTVRQFFNQLEPRPSDERCDGLCDRLVGVKGGTHGLWPASQPARRSRNILKVARIHSSPNPTQRWMGCLKINRTLVGACCCLLCSRLVATSLAWLHRDAD